MAKKQLTDRIVSVTFALKDGRRAVCTERPGVKQPGALRRDTYSVEVENGNPADRSQYTRSELKLLATMFRKCRAEFDALLWKRRNRGLRT